MYGNGAGTGMELTQTLIKQILWVHPRGRSACIAAGSGSTLPGTFVPSTGTTTTRTAGATTSASVFPALSLTGSSGKTALQFYLQPVPAKYPS